MVSSFPIIITLIPRQFKNDFIYTSYSYLAVFSLLCIVLGALHLAGLGRLYLSIGDIETALVSFEEAMSIRQDLGTLDKPEGVEVVEAIIECKKALNHLNDSNFSCCAVSWDEDD